MSTNSDKIRSMNQHNKKVSNWDKRVQVKYLRTVKDKELVVLECKQK